MASLAMEDVTDSCEQNYYKCYINPEGTSSDVFWLFPSLFHVFRGKTEVAKSNLRLLHVKLSIPFVLA